MKTVIADRNIGAELTGLRITDATTQDEYAALRDAIHKYSVVYLRNQDISKRQLAAMNMTLGLGPLKELKAGQEAFLKDFPQIMVLSNILENGKPIGAREAGQYWHSDTSYGVVTNGYAILHALEIPHDSEGNSLGDTVFASAADAYDTLPKDVQQRIQGLRVVHNQYNKFRTKKDKTYTQEGDLTPVSHPVVRTHPVTGRKCIYVNQQYSESIVGMNEADGREMIDYLCQHVTREEALYRHRWQPGDLLFWDDCAIQHCAVGDYQLPQRRLIYRTIVAGVAPA